MGVNKVVYRGRVLIDLSGVTVTPETLAEGVTALDASGNLIVGTLSTTTTENVADITVATRSVWAMQKGSWALVASNYEVAIGVSTPNPYKYIDRSGLVKYMMPVSAKAFSVTVTHTDGRTPTYKYYGLKSNGSGGLTTIFSITKKANTMDWIAGQIDYILISMEDATTAYPWDYADSQVSVEFKVRL